MNGVWETAGEREHVCVGGGGGGRGLPGRQRKCCSQSWEGKGWGGVERG